MTGVADILAFAPHPDDAEIGAGGALALQTRLGYQVVVIDITDGAMASNGTPETRAAEAAEAARILGLAARECLGLPDRGVESSPDQVRSVAEAVRRWRPRLVLAPVEADRHPDHAACARLIREGVFTAALARAEVEGRPHRVEGVAHYFVNETDEPDFLVDVSQVYDLKRRALAAYSSQFGPGSNPTPLNQGYLARLELRDSWFGSRAGVERAEGFRYAGPLMVRDLCRELLRTSDTIG